MRELRKRRVSPSALALKQRMAADAQAAIGTAIAAIYLTLIPLHLVMLEPPYSYALSGYAAVCAVAGLGMRLGHEWLGQTVARVRFTEWVAGGVLCSATLLHGALLSDIYLIDTMALASLAIGMASYWLRPVLVYNLMLVGGVIWLMTQAPGGQLVGHYVVHFALALLLSFSVYAIRMRQVDTQVEAERKQKWAMARLRAQRSQLDAARRTAETAARDADAASRAKTDFLANMSHELRTPLNAIIGFSELMERRLFGELGDSHYEEYAHNIHASGRHLLDLVNDILDLAKIEANKMEIELSRVDAAKVAHECTAMVEAQAQAAGLNLELSAESDLTPIGADARALRQVLLNLLSNAIKFTEEGGTVALEVKRSGAGTVITVRDTGIGISEEDVPRVLAPFVQVAHAMTRQEQGTGLGLPLAKSLTEMMNGSFDLKSRVGEGTTVRLVFPPLTPALADASVAGSGRPEARAG